MDMVFLYGIATFLFATMSVAIVVSAEHKKNKEETYKVTKSKKIADGIASTVSSISLILFLVSAKPNMPEWKGFFTCIFSMILCIYSIRMERIHRRHVPYKIFAISRR